MNRVEQLADRDEVVVPENAIPYKNVIPLVEIVADVLGSGKGTQKTLNEYLYIVTQVAPEFDVLIYLTEDELKKKINPKIVEGILKVRNGEVDIFPGYDGEYGKISIRWVNKNIVESETEPSGQLQLF